MDTRITRMTSPEEKSRSSSNVAPKPGETWGEFYARLTPEELSDWYDDSLDGLWKMRAEKQQKQHGHRHDRIYGDFYFESWFHVLILCCERSPSSNCPGRQRPHWLRRGSYKCPFR